MSSPVSQNLATLTASLNSALEQKLLTQGAVENITTWLSESKYSDYASIVADHIVKEDWATLDDVFWTVIPFGTGGRRGKMFPVGSNAINDRTIGESAQGLAEYVKEVFAGEELSCAIAYDTRHNSRHFAELCAGIMVANGFKVYFIDSFRSTPELSFLVRYKKCNCGIMVTASHNPPSDNAVKVYWNTGGQLVPPHDSKVIEKVMEVDEIVKVPFADAVSSNQVELCLEEIDNALLAEHKKMSFPGPRDLKILYSPLHGVGEFNVNAALEVAGFSDIEVFEPHRKPDGDFPNVPENTSNPENPAVFDTMIAHANANGHDLCMATDPDCDRLGAAAKITLDSDQWKTFNGNQLCALLADYVLSQRKSQGNLTADNYLVSTIVTTTMLQKIAKEYGVGCFDENLVGFKWICNVVDQKGPANFLYGAEESHGYVVGEYVRDKDGAVAAMLLAELAAKLKADGLTLHQHLESLNEKYGFHQERLVNIFMTGSDGMRRMESLMAALRANPPQKLGGRSILQIRDYSNQTSIDVSTKESTKLDCPKETKGNVVIFDIDQLGTRVAVRPSGTEPKVKLYMFSVVDKSEYQSNKDSSASECFSWLDSAENELRAIVDSIE